MVSLLKKTCDPEAKEKTSVMDIGIISVKNNSTNGSRNNVEMRNNNNDNTNRNLESMRNSLIDVEQRLKAQR